MVASNLTTSDLFRQCRYCGDVKPLEQFAFGQSHGRKRRSHQCRQCRNLRHRTRPDYKKKHPGRAPYVAPVSKTCKHCRKHKPVTEFGTYDHGYGLRYGSRCRVCVRGYTRARYVKEHPLAKRGVCKPDLLYNDPNGSGRTCRECRKYLPPSAFHRYRDTKNGKRRLMSVCKPCGLARNRRYSRTAVGSKCLRRSNLRYKHGITDTQWDAMLARQVGVCAICGKPESMVDPRTRQLKKLATDHDAIKGRRAIRGILCARHNIGLGFFDHDPALLRKAAAYLCKHLRKS